VLSKAGLKTKDGSETLPWSEVASIKVAGTVKIQQKGRKRSWFDKEIPNVKVWETLIGEIFAEQSTVALLEE
jgi:hypothetical protein